MNFKDMIDRKKEEIATLFCFLYGKQFYPFFLEKLNQVTFLFPNMYQEDRKQYFYEQLEHPDNLQSIHVTMLLDRLENKNHLGEFLPMIRRNQNGEYLSKNFVILNVSPATMTNQNLDVVLLHELKHYFTYHFTVNHLDDNHQIIYKKVGLSRVIERYSHETIEVQIPSFIDLNEIFTEFDAEMLALKLHESSEIFPNQRFQSIEPIWFHQYFSIFNCFSSNDFNLLHQIEMDSRFDKITQFEEEKILYPLEEKIYFEDKKTKVKKKQQLNYFEKNRKK